MAPVAPDRNGRRRYTPEFKRQQVERILRGEVSAAELSRELDVSRSLIRQWKHLMTAASETAVAAHETVVPESELRAAQQRIRELKRALDRKTMEVEILQAAREEVKNKAHLVRRLPCIAGRPPRRVQAATGRAVTTICARLDIGRATVYRALARGPAATPRPTTASYSPSAAPSCASARRMATAGRPRS
jgi:transposase